MRGKQSFNLLNGTRHSDLYPVLTELESVGASWHKDTMAKWYPWQEPSEPVPLTGRAERQEVNTPYHLNKNILKKRSLTTLINLLILSMNRTFLFSDI